MLCMDSQERDPRGGGDSRSRFLHAGFALLSSGRPLGSVRLLDLTRATGASNGSFYYAWPEGISAYQRDLASYALDLTHVEYLREIQLALADADQAPGSLRLAVMEQGKRDAQELDRDPSFRAQISLWSGQLEDDSVRDELRSQYSRFAEELYIPMYAATLEKYQLETRDPFTLNTLAVVMTALAEGLALRRAVDPAATKLPAAIESQGWDLYGVTLYCLLGAILRPSQSVDRRGATEIVDEMLALRTEDEAAVARAAVATAQREELARLVRDAELKLQELRDLLSRMVTE